jgi:predicted ATPase
MAKLTGVYLKNFQSIREPVFLNLEKLTFFYGPNSVGKSSILDALNLIKTIVSEPYPEPGCEDSRSSLIPRYVPQNEVLTVGIEIEFDVQNFDSRRINESSLWWNKRDREGGFIHNTFFQDIDKKKVRIEFGNNANQIKISIEGKDLFSFEYESVFVDFDYSKRKPEKEDLEELLIGDCLSRVIIPKDSILMNSKYDGFFGTNWRSPNKSVKYRPDKSFFYNFFCEENDDAYIYNGIKSLQFENQRIVGLDYFTESLLFDSENDLRFDLKDLLGNDVKEFFERRNKLQSILDSDFNSDEKLKEKGLSLRRSIYRGLEDLAFDLNLIVEGLFLEIEEALQFSHVRGDRGIIDSENTTSYGDSLNEYAFWLGSGFIKNPRSENDFVNLSIDQYFPSLKGYQVVPNVMEIKNVYEYTKAKKNESYIGDADRNHVRNEVFLYVLNKTGERLNLKDVGSGVSYVLPILCSVIGNGFSFIEQPELHLHPKSQCEIGDVFIASLNKGHTTVVESHSEHLLLRILRRIRETHKGYLIPKELKIKPEDITIYYFQPTENGTRIKHIRVDEYGEFIDRWPDGFFSERDKELFDE